MPNAPETSDTSGGGLRQKRAAKVRAEQERRKTEEQAAAQRQAEQQQRAQSTEADQTQQGDTAEEPSPEATGTGPVGAGDYIVKEGDCISSIAVESGHVWTTIWEDPANSELRQVRENPNTLLPDDRVTIPPLRRKDEPGETEMHHRFRHRGAPEMLRMRLVDEFNEPCTNVPYILIVDGDQRQGTTNADGELQERIAANAREAQLLLDNDDEVITLHLGHLHPITEISGVQARLSNLGFNCGPVTGELNERTRDAIKEFQTHCSLRPTGRLDEQTRDALAERYGC